MKKNSFTSKCIVGLTKKELEIRVSQTNCKKIETKKHFEENNIPERQLKGQYHLVTSWFQKKRAWQIIISMEITIAIDNIYQKNKMIQIPELGGQCYALIDAMFIETM